MGTEDMYPESPIAYTYNDDGYICTQDGDDTDIFVIKSPYYTYAALCSPCAPGAGYLMNWLPISEKIKEAALASAIFQDLPDGYKSWIDYHMNQSDFPRVYCFGHDWFESGKAPYPVFSIEAGKLV